MKPYIYYLGVGLICLAQSSNAAVTLYYDIHNPSIAKQAWMNAAGPYTRIDFTGFAANTIITNQYAHLGVLFTDGTDRIHFSGSFLEDGVGLNGAFDDSRLEFLQPMHTLAFDCPGTIKFVLYSDGRPIYDSDIVHGAGAFVGIVSTEAFDTVQITDPLLGLVYDTLYFGAPVPGPCALGLIFAGMLLRTGRRRGTAGE